LGPTLPVTTSKGKKTVEGSEGLIDVGETNSKPVA